MIRSASIGVVCLAFLSNGCNAALAQEAGKRKEPTYQELLQILKTAKPAPTTVPPQSQARRVGVPNQVYQFDPQSGRSSSAGSGPRIRASAAERSENKGAGAPRIAKGSRPLAPDAEDPEISPNISPTQPSPILNTTVFPYQSVWKLLMRYNVGGTDYYWVCSASSRGSFQLLTAGHCVYSWDPNNDGNTSDKKWADEIWAWAAQTDRVVPIGTLDFPYGTAKGTWWRTYNAWINSSDFNYDFGFLTLDRRTPDLTGWMGAESSVATSLNFDGYPAETPYVPAGEYRQYPGFDSGNVSGSTGNRINLDAFVYGGHSGGPAWRYNSSDGTRYVEGINSTSDRIGHAGLTRVTGDMINDMATFKSEDASARQPTDRPNLIEYLFSTASKDLLTNTVTQGQSISVLWSALNVGQAATGPMAIDFYLSTNTTISTADTLIGTLNLNPLGAWTAYGQTNAFTVSLNQPVGDYYVGWIMRTNNELDTADNTVVISNETVHVNQRLLPPGAVTLGWPHGQLTAQRPNFHWSPAARSSNYHLWVRRRDAAHTVVRSTDNSPSAVGCANEASTCVFQIAKSLPLGRYEWAVQASNAAGSGPRSDWKLFSIVKRTADSVALGD